MPTPPAPAAAARTTRILGVHFHIGSLNDLTARLSGGGLFVFPSGPGLAELDRNPPYRHALEESDVAVTDSGAMVLLWWLHSSTRVPRISGLRFLRALLQLPNVQRPTATFWVMPSEREAAAALAWLGKQGHPVERDDFYVAPRYDTGAPADAALVATLQARRPQFVVLCIGGGVQEPLGLSLREALDFRPAILCTGAAIAFLTGQQAPIPVWADRLMIGWLIRSLWAPRRFVPRYLRAWHLLRLIRRFGANPVRP